MSKQLKGRTVLALNNQVLSVLPGDEVVYEAMDKIISDDPRDQFTYPEKFLNSLNLTGMPPYKLHLKIGYISGTDCVEISLWGLSPPPQKF